jgi:hypothetical protein
MDSIEEVQFAHWLDEAKERGVVIRWDYHPEPFELSKKVSIYERKKYITPKKQIERTKTIKRCLARGHIYQADFKLLFDLHSFKFSHGLISVDKFTYYIDIKGAYHPNSDHKQLFSVNQKWVLQKHGVYVNKVIPEKFFKKTWVPKAVAFMSNRKKPTRRKKFIGCKLLEEV